MEMRAGFKPWQVVSLFYRLLPSLRVIQILSDMLYGTHKLPRESIRVSEDHDIFYSNQYPDGKYAHEGWSRSFDETFPWRVLSENGYKYRRQDTQRLSLLRNNGALLVLRCPGCGCGGQQESPLLGTWVQKVQLDVQLDLLRTFVCLPHEDIRYIQDKRHFRVEVDVNDKWMLEIARKRSGRPNAHSSGVDSCIEKNSNDLIIHDALELLEIKTKKTLKGIFDEVKEFDSDRILLHYRIDMTYIAALYIVGFLRFETSA